MDNRMPPVSEDEAEAYAKMLAQEIGEGANMGMEYYEGEEDFDMEAFKRVYAHTKNPTIAYNLAGGKHCSAFSGYPSDAELEAFSEDPQPCYFRRKSKKPSHQALSGMKRRIANSRKK